LPVGKAAARAPHEATIVTLPSGSKPPHFGASDWQQAPDLYGNGLEQILRRYTFCHQRRYAS
jgi:hypothetical protein